MRVLPEEKVKALIELMNSTTMGKIPPQEPILECFDMAMDEKMLDYLLAVGAEPPPRQSWKRCTTTCTATASGRHSGKRSCS